MAELTQKHVEEFIKTDTKELELRFTPGEILEMTNSLQNLIGDNQELREAYLLKLNELTDFNKEGKKLLQSGTQEQLSSLIDEVTGTILPEGVDKDAAFNTVKNALEIEMPISSEEFKIKLMEYQTIHRLKSDGRIGKETYYEAKAGEISENLVGDITKDNISKDTQNQILDILGKANQHSLNIIGINTLLTNFKVKDPNNIVTYSLFYAEVDKLASEYNNSPEGQASIATAEEQSETLYEMAKNGDWEGIMKDPTLLLAGGVLFLCGVFGGDTKYTDSIWKRLGIVVTGAIFGPDLLNHLGGNQIIADIKGAASKVTSTVTKIAPEAKEATIKLVTQTMPGAVSGLSFDMSSITGAGKKVFEKIGEKLDNLTTGFGSYNEKLKDEDGNPKEGYIKEKPLVALTGLISDAKFINLSKGDLVNLKNKSSLFAIISLDNQKKLNDAGVTDKDIENFIDNHLDDAFKNDPDAVLVKDLFYTTSIKELLVSSFANGKYLEEDQKLNSMISKNLSILINSTEAKNRNLGLELVKAIKLGEIDKFNTAFTAGNFIGINGDVETKVVNIIKIVESYNTVQEEVELKINEIERIKPTNTSNLQKETLEDYLEKLEGIELDATKTDKIKLSNTTIDGANTSKFKEAQDAKRKEILTWAKNSGINTLIGISGTVDDELAKEEKAKELLEVKKTLEEIEIIEIPTSNETPKEFKAKYDANKEAFDLVEKHKDSTDPEIKKLTEAILEKKTEFKTNYEAMKIRVVEELTKLEGEIAIIPVDNTVDIETTRANIKKKSEEYKTILETIMIVDLSTLLDNAKSFINQISTGLVILNIPDNAFTKLDEEFDIPGKEVTSNVDALLKTKLETLEGNYQVTNIDISYFADTVKPSEIDEGKLKEVIAQLQRDHSVVAGFDTDKRGEKFKNIEAESKKIRNLFLNLINMTDDKNVLENIYKLYVDTVQSNLGKYVNNDTSIIEGWKAYFNINKADVVKTKYDEVMKALEDEEIKKDKEKRLEEVSKEKVVDVYKNNPELFKPYEDFYNKYFAYKIIESDGPKLMRDPNLTIKLFLAKLSNYKTLPQNKLLDKDGKKISTLKFDGVDPAYDGFHKNVEDMIEAIENNITNI